MRPSHLAYAYLAFATGSAVATVPEHLAKHLRRQSASSNSLASASASACTSTFIHFNTFTQGPVKTVWATTETSTAPLDCGTCPYVTVKNAGGRGPVVNFKTTTTVDTATTATTYVCVSTSTAAE